MYRIFEVSDSVNYYLVYVSEDLELCSRYLCAYKKKYPDRKYLMLQIII